MSIRETILGHWVGERGVSCRGTFRAADCTISGTIFLPPLTNFSFTATLRFKQSFIQISGSFLPTPGFHFAMTLLLICNDRVQLCLKSDRPKSGTDTFPPLSYRAQLCFINLLQFVFHFLIWVGSFSILRALHLLPVYFVKFCLLAR